MQLNDENKEQIFKSQKNKSWIIIMVIIVLIGLIIGGYFVFVEKSNKTTTSGQGNGNNRNKNTSASSGSSDINWQMTNDGGYQANGTPPTCPSPLALLTPTDLSKVVSILYPGQTRGGDYKPHGGFRFADGANQVDVIAPMDASVVDGGRYLVNGEIQYIFDFINSCGIQYRLGHLRTLSFVFENIANQFPEAQEMDSRTTQVMPPVKVKAGDTIATAVGLLGEGNAFFDFGVFDLRQTNEASKDSTFQVAHSSDKSLSWHGVCWFNLLNSQDEAKVKSLPATSPGSESDYCK